MGVQLIPNCTPRSLIDRIIQRMENSELEQATVFQNKKRLVQQNVRETKVHYLTRPDPLADEINAHLKRILEPRIPKGIDWWENPQLLQYGPGGKYEAHVDNAAWNQGKYVRNLNRDFSIVIFLNEGFRGGDLVFTEQGQTVIPKTGSVVIFPADKRFKHEVKMVETGIRRTLVTWIKQRFSPMLRNGEHPSHRVYPHTVRT